MSEGSSNNSSSDYLANNGRRHCSEDSTRSNVLSTVQISLDTLISKEWSNVEERVLVLYTGGTIGMARNDRGALEPKINDFERRIRRYPHMHDEYLAKEKYPNSPFLVLPVYKEKHYIIYMIYEYSPLLDSSNMTCDNWASIAKDIRSVYQMFDGFVILQGTDTLCYSASALSFMLENLGKPVVITGSQIPIFETRSDGRDNFIGSIIMAGVYKIPEVTVFFNNKLLRGNRTRKVSSNRLQAFESPNMQPLAQGGISININHNLIFKQTIFEKFQVCDKLCRHVGLLHIFPFITTETVQALLAPPTEGVVIQTYGAGNIPNNRTDIIELLKEATKRNVIVINITQCLHGSVEALYETGAVLADAGVISGYDMTPETALTKLSYVLAKDWNIETKRKAMMTNIRGEMTKKEDEQNLVDFIASLCTGLQITSKQKVGQVKDLLFPTILFSAVAYSDLKCLEELYKNNFDLNVADLTGWTALHMAAHEGNIEVISWLIKHGAIIHVRDVHGHTPLKIAIEHDKVETIKLFVRTGAHLTESSVCLGELLCQAAAENNANRLKSYHYASVRLDTRDQCGRTALHVACTVGSMESAQFLLDTGVSGQSMDDNHLTPLMCAENNNHEELAQMIKHYII